MLKLKDFYQLYLDWVDAGAVEPTILHFSRSMGLCDNLVSHGNMLRQHHHAKDLKSDMVQQFKDDELDEIFPFNNKDAEEYSDEVMKGECHLNPKRIDWLRQQVKE